MFMNSKTSSADARLISTLDDVKAPVFALSFSPGGKYLASGDGLRIWDLEKKMPMKIPRQAPQEREQVCALCWFTQTKGYDMVCYGNAMGFLVLLKCRLGQDHFEIVTSSRVANGREIVCLAAAPLPLLPDVTCIALSTRDQCMQIWSFKAGTHELSPLHSKIYGRGKNILPKALAFDNDIGRSLFVFGLFDGGLYKYDGDTVKNISQHQLGSQIGNASVDLEHRICVIDNVINGFDAYHIDSGTFIQEYRACEAKRTHPKGIAFGNNSRLVIGGSDHGKVYIFNRETGGLLRTLIHTRNGGVETIAATDTSDGCVYVASASSTTLNSEKNSIHIWQLKPALTPKTNRQWSLTQIMDCLIRIGAVIVVIAYLCNSRRATEDFQQVFTFRTDRPGEGDYSNLDSPHSGAD